MAEAAKYYANILWPFSTLVLRKIEEVQKLGLKINMIAPSHGVIWRKDPEKIINAYLSWARGEARRKALVVYDTMWGSTEKMAKAMVEGLRSEGVEVMMFRLPYSDRSDIVKELLDARGLLMGSGTINNGILPTVAPFLEDLVGLKPRGKIAAAFGSYGWGGGAVKHIEESLKKAGMEIVLPGLEVNWVPNKEELQKCFEFGREFARRIGE
jgi:flavorubredoxin